MFLVWVMPAKSQPGRRPSKTGYIGERFGNALSVLHPNTVHTVWRFKKCYTVCFLHSLNNRNRLCLLLSLMILLYRLPFPDDMLVLSVFVPFLVCLHKTAKISSYRENSSSTAAQKTSFMQSSANCNSKSI